MDWTNRTRSIASKSSTLQGRSTAVVKARGWGAPAGAGGGGSAPEGVVRAIAKAGGDESAPHARADGARAHQRQRQTLHGDEQVHTWRRHGADRRAAPRKGPNALGKKRRRRKEKPALCTGGSQRGPGPPDGAPAQPRRGLGCRTGRPRTHGRPERSAFCERNRREEVLQPQEIKSEINEETNLSDPQTFGERTAEF